MDWQVLAVWMVAGAVVIAIIARWFLRRVFERGGGTDGNNGKGNRGDKGKPPCCG